MTKIIIKILLSVIFTFIVLFWVFVKLKQPNYNGSEVVNGLNNEVEVYYDEVGVPHIYAETEEDAYLSLGYVHAQDRLWQMEVLRRIASGRLSELFGEKTIEVDKFFKSLGIVEAVQIDIEKLDVNSKYYKLTQAYLKGVNQFVKDGVTPVEYHLVGVEKEEFHIKDIYNVFGYMAFSFAMAHKTDPMLTDIKMKLGNSYLKDLNIELDSLETQIPGVLSNYSSVSTALNSMYSKLPFPTFIGSNSWVLGEGKTKNGKVIFENDPHISFSQPSVWYQAHIKTPQYESYGFHLGLVPFPILAHNREYAYGITMFENDDIDFYEEKEAGKGGYLYNDQELKYNLETKTIKVKGENDISYEVKKSIHGPIMNSVLDKIHTEKQIAMDWVYTKHPNKLLEVCYGMSHAKSLKEFESAAAMIHAPGLNIMYGDAEGNIAWWAAAKLYERENKANSKFILNGEKGEDDRLNYVPFSSNPQAVNPKSNYVYSANNQSYAVLEEGGKAIKKRYHGYYLPEDRAKRIVELVEDKNDFSNEDVMEMALDVTSSTAKEFLSYFDVQNNLETNNEKKALKFLKNWKCDFTKESVAATIYMKLTYVYLEQTMKDELGNELFNEFLNTHIHKRTIGGLIKKESSIWWDNIKTKKIESRKEILNFAFKKTIRDLEKQLGDDVSSWKWKRVHTVEHKHPIGEVALLRRFFNVGPFETDGANEVLNNLQYNVDSTGVYKVKAGPSTRRVVDFSDVENSMSIIPTGQSGNVFSKHYKDQAEDYLYGRYYKMLINDKEIKKN
jgi:penicillin amidase